MILFIWLAVPVLIGGAVLLVAFWLHQRCRVPLVMLAIAAGFYLLSFLAGVIIWVGVHAAGIRNGVMFAVVLAPAIGAVCAETSRYLSFRASRSMRVNRTIEGALMVGLGYGGMGVIIVWVFYLLRYRAYWMRYAALPGSWLHAGLFVLSGVVGYALSVIIQLGLATLVVLAYRRSLLFLPLAVLAGFAVTASTHALVMVHGVTWPVAVCWAAAAMALVVLVHRSGWLTVAPQDEPAAVAA
jgi:hypothetical protein